jgi:hypothetical protein
MTHTYSLQILRFVIPLANLAVYYPLTLLDEIQGEVSKSILFTGYFDTMFRVPEKLAQGSSFSCTES